MSNTEEKGSRVDPHNPTYLDIDSAKEASETCAAQTAMKSPIVTSEISSELNAARAKSEALQEELSKVLHAVRLL